MWGGSGSSLSTILYSGGEWYYLATLPSSGINLVKEVEMLVKPKFDRKRDMLGEILEWLYIHEADYTSMAEWRTEFIKKLKEVLE